ncbi:NlpC/P60 family protein [Corynebacterium guangdongense]|uniref:Cell wall-associated NlpC family hydrolase n=1 Tax=Corynebacterium guangdongense TaxID=1783348 RepID=A0ABU1ZXU8_9CORY|nr:NlpC/P60 family protein [Corynebacterium guangdongense]MDR7329762.1 cell wall-associated NlpC family hydrolase [Corynebacterium guangdongense]WJZ18326.1 putative endopeptidase precursor [Corynebacterium guangdongense]
MTPQKANLVRRIKHHRTNRLTATSTVAAIAASGILLAPGAGADELDDLMAELETVSHEATAKSEEVKALEDSVDSAEQDLARLAAEADTAGEKAQHARELQVQFQAQVDGVAGAKYRVDALDPVTNALSAENPQNMIDRSAYLGTLSRTTTADLDALEGELRAAAAEASRAHAAVAEANFHRSILSARQRDLEEQRSALAEDVEAIEARIDALNAEQREAWINQNNPVEPNPAVDLSSAAASLSGAGAVGAALSKLGSPYSWGATGPSAFDCSGLMYWAYQQQGKTIPRTSQAQLAGGMSVALSDLQPGDIIGYYPGTTHVGMYIGNGQVVHASDYGIPVQVVPFDSMPITGASRY